MKDGLTELEAFVAVARKGNFRAAAVDLDMSPSALSRAISALEERLGIRLFNRTTRSVALSEAGNRFLARVAPALLEIRDAMEEVNTLRDVPQGTLRINTAVGAVRQILQPVILEYLCRYPEMKVDIVSNGRFVDIVAEGFDAGIRLRDAVPKDMVAFPLGPEQRFVVVGSPGYFASVSRPQTPHDLMQHKCIRFRMPSGIIYRWEFEKKGESLAMDVDGALTLDESSLVLQAALAGTGLAYLAEWYVKSHIESGELIQVLEDWTPSFPGMYLYYPSRRHSSAGLRALIELLRERRF